MDPNTTNIRPLSATPITRRQLLERSGMGLGSLAFWNLLMEDGLLQAEGSKNLSTPIDPNARAKSVIFLFMGGGPSHIDTFDPKPELNRLDGQDTPESIQKLFKRTATMGNGTRKLMACPFEFKQHGKSGLPVSSLLPHTAQHVDDLCLIRSMQHDTIIHTPGQYMLTTGTIVGDRPSLGAWSVYGLGSDNKDLPGFVLLGDAPRPAYGAGFLPAQYQGTKIVDPRQGIPNIHLPKSVSETKRREQLTLIDRLNRRHLERLGEADLELEARIRSYELSFRMQTNAPETFAIDNESEKTRELYGLHDGTAAPVGAQCLLARRLVERGVRFVQVWVGGWDSHSDLKGGHEGCAARSDRPVAGLLADLKQRGLLDSTLVVWGGEFGRTPGAEGGNGRDHSPGGFTVWLAGGGVKGGQIIGETDPVGYTAIDRPIHPNSLHATILHALGVEQTAISYVHNGREEIPTFVESDVVHDVFA